MDKSSFFFLSRTNFLIFAFVLLSSSSRAALTEEPTPVPRQEKEDITKTFPKGGTIASSGGGATAVSAGGFGDTSLGKEDSAPISGSVSKEKGTWVARVYNNSDETISATFSIVQTAQRGAKIKSDTFSTTLGPKKNSSYRFPVAPNAENYLLNLTQWKVVKH